jgi:uracil-DNA glycosylase
MITQEIARSPGGGVEERLATSVHDSWREALAPAGDRLTALTTFLREEEAAGRGYLPAARHVLRAFERPFDDVRVLIVGQDPYPTPGHAVGLSFSVDPHVAPLPRSLQNIYRELVADTGLPAPTTGDLSPWADRGILLLNRVLTVQPGASGSHRGRGWEEVTNQAVRALAARGGPLVAVLWGREAQSLRPLLGDVPVVESAHPSPLSASRGFFGSRPFSRVDELLTAQGAEPRDWSLP